MSCDKLEIDLAGQAALVTGASRGIGRAVAERLAAHGARVAVHYHRRRQLADTVVDELPGRGHVALQADVADPRQAEALVREAVDRLGGIDILVNNAGIYELHALAEVDLDGWLDVWQRTIGINLLGPANVTFCVARQMIERGGGRIVNVSSRGAFRGEPQAPAYGASKAGLNSLSQSLAQALAPHNITVTVVAPGFVETDMTEELLVGEAGEAIRKQSPLGRVARPEEVADVVLFLASGRADYTSGTIVDVNGASYLRS